MATVGSGNVQEADGSYSQQVRITGGSVSVGSGSVSSGTAVSLSSGTSSATVVASNTSRTGLILNNTDANICYVKFGSSASASSFTAQLNPGDYWEMPAPIYTGIVTAIWAADGSGALIGTEL